MRHPTLLICLLCAAGLHAQDAGPIIRSESREVLVDAVAVDKKGHFAQDLTQKDFRVWEDGREQKISAFSLESSGVNPERPGKHYIAMFFDTNSGAGNTQISERQQGVRFVDGFASPDRYMAVINYSVDGGARIAQNFTTDRDLLKKALNQVPASRSATALTASTAAPARGGRNIAPVPTSDAFADNFSGHDMLAALRNLAKSLSTVRGRKAVVFFTSGLTGSADMTSDLTATIDACNKANVAVYTVSTAATATDMNNAFSDQGGQGRGAPRAGTVMPEANGQNFIASLAQSTGGISFLVTNDLAGSLGKVAQEQDQYYLLSYTPTVESAEGSCHELKVKVDRGDLEIRARHSYCTSKPVDLLSGKPVGRDLETRAAGNASGAIAAKMQLPWFYSAPNIARVNLAIDLIPGPIKFQKEKGKLRGEFSLAGVAWKADGTAAARMSDSVKVDFDTQLQVDAFLKSPYHYESQFEIAPGQYTFRMAIGSDASGPQAFGKVELPLKIEPWNGQSLSESGIALSHTARPATDLADGLDTSLLDGMRPLVARGAEVIPAGATSFHSTETAYFYVEAYDPALAKGAVDSVAPVAIRVRVLARPGGQQIRDGGPKLVGGYARPGNPIIPMALPLPLAGLQPGAYTLEVSVMHQNDEPVVRTADFDVN